MKLDSAVGQVETMIPPEMGKERAMHREIRDRM